MNKKALSKIKETLQRIMQQEEWLSPENRIRVLRFYNSITKSYESFSVKEGNIIKWYVCGPNVYDSAHLGYARTYVSFDIIRSILELYFGYEVIYAMNITDIDDKIMKKAREYGKKSLEETCKEIRNK